MRQAATDKNNRINIYEHMPVKMIEQTYENSKKKIAINVDDIIDGEELNLSDDEDVNQEEPKIDPEEEER